MTADHVRTVSTWVAGVFVSTLLIVSSISQPLIG